MYIKIQGCADVGMTENHADGLVVTPALLYTLWQTNGAGRETSDWEYQVPSAAAYSSMAPYIVYFKNYDYTNFTSALYPFQLFVL